MNKTPTFESYGELDEAYAFFNDRLFASTLPPCLITLHRHKSFRGYFWAQKFEHRDGEHITDEIALNPDCFKGRADTETFSTLVHEMAHLWQHRFGKPSRNGYHNKQWAEKMDTLGLTPTTTGKPGGKRTGQKCSHYIADDGPFSHACAELLTTGLAVTWRSLPKLAIAGKSGQRIKYACALCEAAAWGKEGLRIECRDCSEPMERAA